MRYLAAAAALFIGPAAFGSGDHHMHIYSPAGAAVWQAMCDVMSGGCGEYELPEAGKLAADDAVRVLDEAGLQKGAILSLAYFYGYPRLAASEFDDHAYVRGENEYVRQEVAKYPDRLVGFFSFNPLADYAVDEARYWGRQGELAGLKLHLTNSGFDFGDPEHMRRLLAVLEVTNGYSMPVVIHMRPGGSDYGYDHAAQFITQIASRLPSTDWYLAHMAGWGGYDAGTDGAIQAFLDAFANGSLDRSRVWFDLAAVVSDDLPASALTMLRGKIDRIGIDRIVFGSDWDEVEPASYLDSLKTHLRLSEAEWQKLVDNQAPFFR